LVIFCLLCFSVDEVKAQVWQWSASVPNVFSPETNDHLQAFLWIPPGCHQLKGVVLGQHNMLEEGILEHPDFRKTLAALDFGEIWVTPGLDLVFDFQQEAGAAFDSMIHGLADSSGYHELDFIPVVPIVHSAAASFSWNFAAWNPSRALAVLSVHGDAPLTNKTGSGCPSPDWGCRTIDGIPGLMVMGEYKWREDRIMPALTFVKAHPRAAISFLAYAGHGHFDFSDALMNYLATFIRKAAEYRISKDSKPDSEGHIALKSVNPEEGYLMERWMQNHKERYASGTYSHFGGDRQRAFWYFDRDMTERTQRYYKQAQGKKMQYIGIAKNGQLFRGRKYNGAVECPF